jgi:hypothetical protein
MEASWFDSDMSKNTNTVVYFDWKTVIYDYACGQCLTQFTLRCCVETYFMNFNIYPLYPLYVICIFYLKCLYIVHIRLCHKWETHLKVPRLQMPLSKNTNTVVYFDWKTVIYDYACGQCLTQFMLPNSSRRKLINMYFYDGESQSYWWSIRNYNIVCACFNCTSHIINFGYETDRTMQILT